LKPIVVNLDLIVSTFTFEDFKSNRCFSINQICLHDPNQAPTLAKKLEIESNLISCGYKPIDNLVDYSDRIVVSWISDLIGTDQKPIERFGVLLRGKIVVPDIVLPYEVSRLDINVLGMCCAHYIQLKQYENKRRKSF
jgi:hypothetical protein